MGEQAGGVTQPCLHACIRLRQQRLLLSQATASEGGAATPRQHKCCGGHGVQRLASSGACGAAVGCGAGG